MKTKQEGTIPYDTPRISILYDDFMGAPLHDNSNGFCKRFKFKKATRSGKKNTLTKHSIFIKEPENFNKIFPHKKRLLKLCA